MAYILIEIEQGVRGVVSRGKGNKQVGWIKRHLMFSSIEINSPQQYAPAADAGYQNAIQIHTPVHASWLSQIEIYFSVVQRKLLTPNDFPDLETVEQRLLAFQSRYEKIAKPFKWKFTKDDLNRILSKLSDYDNIQIKQLAA